MVLLTLWMPCFWMETILATLSKALTAVHNVTFMCPITTYTWKAQPVRLHGAHTLTRMLPGEDSSCAVCSSAEPQPAIRMVFPIITSLVPSSKS